MLRNPFLSVSFVASWVWYFCLMVWGQSVGGCRSLGGRGLVLGLGSVGRLVWLFCGLVRLGGLVWWLGNILFGGGG